MKRKLLYAAVLFYLLITPNGLLAEDVTELFKETYQQAEAGDVEATYNLGRMYYKGEGVSQDYKKALKWLFKAAEQGNAGAQNNLGWMYYKGEGVSQDYKEAIKRFSKAAVQGNTKAQGNLSMMCAKGEGLPQDYKEAFMLFFKAAEQGNAGAQNNLGIMYYYGKGVPQDYKEALKWISKSAEQGNADAQYNLALMYANGQGVPRDYKKAVRWFSIAAEQGAAHAQRSLGVMYANGYGVPQDYKEALKWISKSAEQGNADAQGSLAFMYSKGDGVPQDYKEAVKWYTKAAEQGCVEAQCNLGNLYCEGQGVPEDYVQAYKWYILAAAQNPENAKHNRELLRKQMTPSQIAEAQRLSREFRPRAADTVAIPEPAKVASTGKPGGQAPGRDPGGGPSPEAAMDVVDVDRDIPKGKAKRPDGIAVIIGNGHYSRYGNGIPDVTYATRDAAYMKKYVVETLGFDEKNLIYEQDVTQGSLATIFGTGNNYRGKLYNYVKAGKSDVFVYYTGHGAPDPAGKGAFLVPVDANLDYIASNGYPLETFYKNLGKVREKIGNGRMTVILDACFSGDSGGGVLFRNISPAMIKTASPVGNLEEAVIFTSAGESEVSQWYPDKRHSLFTYFFMKGLQGDADRNKNKTITVGEMRDYLKDNVPYLARRLGGREQNPVIVGEESLELVSFR